MAVEFPSLPEDLPTSAPRWVGRGINRVEDPVLLTGRADFIDNLTRPGMLHCAILRSPYAHARIVSIDMSKAAAHPGVAAVVAGEDALRWTKASPTSPAGWGTYCIATEKVSFVGEPVAAVAVIVVVVEFSAR